MLSTRAAEILRSLKNTYYYDMADSVDQIIKENGHLDVPGLLKWIEETQTDTQEEFLYRKGILRNMPRPSQNSPEEGRSHIREVSMGNADDEIKHIPAIDELIGLVDGINYDGIVKDLEVQKLSEWLGKNAGLLQNTRYGTFLNELREILRDGIIDDEERDLLIRRAYEFKADVYDVEQSLNILAGILDGIICDKEIADEEVFHLYEWISDNEHLQGVPIYDRIEKILDIILEDNIISEEEKDYFLTYTSQIVSASKDIDRNHWSKGNISFETAALTDLIESVLHEKDGLRTREIASLIPGAETVDVDRILHAKENRDLFVQSDDYEWHVLSSDFKRDPETDRLSVTLQVSSDLPDYVDNMDIRQLNLSNRSFNSLKRSGIDTVSQLAELSRDDLFRIRNLGALSVDEILNKLEYYTNGSVGGQSESKECGELARLNTLKKDIPIDVLDLSVRAYNCLVGNGYTLLNHLAGKTRDDLLSLKSMGRGSAGEVIRKINDFLDTNKGLYDDDTDISEAPYIREQIKDQLRSVIRNAGLSGIEQSAIAEVVDGDLWERLIKGLVEELKKDEEIVETEPGLYHQNFPSILDLIEEIKNGRNRDMVRSWLNGRRLSQIAIAYGISRQRVQQIVSRGIGEALSHATEVREDRLKYVFTTYEIGKKNWEICFRELGYAYRYLGARYQRGTKPISEALEDELVSEEIKDSIRKCIENPDGFKYEVESETEDNDEREGTGILSNIRLTEGNISYVIQYYEGLNEKERHIQLYVDRAEYEKRALRLKKRIARELKRRKYISDIKINEEEYETLRGYLHYSIPLIQKSKVIPDKDLFITAVVQAAIRAYKDGNFWSNFYEEIQIEQKLQYRTTIGNAFYSILEERDIIRVAPNEYVQNILLHCFISNNYADAYFDFLYAFYRIDLDRDIDRLDRELMNELMGSICSEDNEGRTFMLVKHIGQAMAANQRGAKIRIRNHLKLMDRFFWDPEYKIVTDHRINNLLQQWVEKNERIKSDIEEYSTGRRQGKKRFSSPYIFLDEAENAFRIVLPAQSIKQMDTYDISWKIIGSSEYRVPVELTESVLGFKVLESEIEIPWKEVLEAYNIDLIIDDTEESIKRFKIKKADLRLFDENGYPINTAGIKVGDVISISRENDVVESNALYDSRIVDGMRMSYFQFEFEDIVKFPNGHAIIVGKKEIQNSIAGKGCVEGAVCSFDDNQYALYGKIPHLVLRMLPERANGTMIAINGQRHRLTDFDYRQFSLDDRSDDVGFYMNLADVIDEESNDLYRIDVDVPNSIKKTWRFVYIKNFEVQFEDAPYVFEPRGTARFPEHIPILDIEEGCVKEPGINGFKFEIMTVGRTMGFITSVGEKKVLVNLNVPAFFIQRKDGQWDSEKPEPVWHADLPDVLKLSVPYHKITLSMEQEQAEESDRETREIEYRRNNGSDCIECDITRFKSYLSGDDTIKSLGMRFGDIDTELMEIMIHSKIVSCQLIGDFSEKAFRINAVIQGKSEYYADIREGDSIIADKVKIENGKAIIPWDIKNGWYEVDIFEVEEDESGFGDAEYYCIGQYRQKLLDPYDMTGRSFRILQIESKDNPKEIMSFGIQYYVEDLEKTSKKDVYQADMVVEKNSGEIIAYLPVSVYFADINNPNYVWITFIDEYNEEADFLYDTRRRGILQEENSKISKLACYRRYTVLDYEERVFHIEFCEREERDYDEIDEAIVFQEDSLGIRFRPTSKHRKREKPVSDISWSKAEYFCIRATGDLTLDQLAKRTRREFISVTGASEEITTRIEQIMSFYGYQFSKTSSSSKLMPSDAVALPKTHGIRVEDIKWRNARARACLDKAGIKTLDRLAMMTKQEFSELKSVNDAVIGRVEQVLAQYGYKFRQE